MKQHPQQQLQQQQQQQQRGMYRSDKKKFPRLTTKLLVSTLSCCARCETFTSDVIMSSQLKIIKPGQLRKQSKIIMLKICKVFVK
jgi:hypothetical protein